LTDGINGSKQQAIVDNRHKPGDRPEDKVERPRCGVGIGQRSDMEVCRLAEEHAGHGDGGRRRAKRRYRILKLRALCWVLRRMRAGRRCQETGKLRHIQEIAMADGSEAMPKKRAYQWFFLFICVARSA
jgi:hypothetical protein